VCTKLFAKGFRNPFRFQLRAGTGPVVGDVGWNTREELDLTEAGKSYGWPCWEGELHTPGYKDLPECAAHYSSPDVGPAHFYDHSINGGGAVVAGPQVTTTRYPAAWRNSWFVGDYVQGWLRAYDISNGQITNVRDFAASGFDGVDLELTPEGDLAYLRFTDGTFNSARLERIVNDTAPPPAVLHATPTAGASPLQVAFSADEWIDPHGDAVTYEWDFGDGSAVATGRTLNHTYTAGGVYTATLTVRDARGLASEDSVQIRVDRTPPVLSLQAPADGSLFRHGVPVTLQASATDLEDGDLDDEIEWHVLLHHGTHTHSGGDFTGPEATFTPPGDHDADSYYTINARITDSDGLFDETTVEIRPETVPFTLDSSPAGVALSYSGSEVMAPVTLTSAIGYHTSVSAPAEITRDGDVWTFDRWSDGGARQHDITIPAAASTLTATYEAPDDGGSPPGGGPPPPGGGAGPTPSPASTPGPRPEPPRVKLDGARRRARTLSGRITGLTAEPRVRIALRTARSHGACRHWNARKRGLGRKVKRCSAHVWMTARLSPVGIDGWRWRVRLRGRLGRGRYVVVARVTDRRGRPLLSASPLALRVR
jgi:PKD repeat protein